MRRLPLAAGAVAVGGGSRGRGAPQLVSLDEIRSGGPPPDGIPPIDDPMFVTGAAIDGPLAGTKLERLQHDDTLWFVQFAFRPGTRVEDTSAAPANPRPAGA